MAVQEPVSMSDLPASLAAAVSPSDSADLYPKPCRALYIGGAGNVSVDMTNGDTVLFSGVTAGSFLPISVRRVRNTNTTATLIVALY